MSPLLIVLISECVLLNLSPMAQANDCPKSMPLKIGKFCYRLQTDPFNFNDARDNCMRMESGGMMTSYKSQEVLVELQERVYEIILSKLETSGVFWIGIKMEDRSMSKAAQDRDWTVDYDESKFVQKDYKYWDKDGGPTDKGLTCAATDGTNEWKVAAVDCGGPRLGFICMMREGERCRHNMLPYLAYGKYCVGVVGGEAYNKLHGACHPNQPTPYQDEEMQLSVQMAAKNSFLYGGIFMNMRRNGPMFVDLSDGSSPPADMWEEGEPRDEYDCVVLSVQHDNTLKLKTMNCEFRAFSLCFVQLPDEEEESSK